MVQKGRTYRWERLRQGGRIPVGHSANLALIFLLTLLAPRFSAQAQCPSEVQVLQPITCSGADDGVLSVELPDGVDPADVYWLQDNDTLFGSTQSNLGPGSYVVFIPGCPALGTNLNEPFTFFISAAITRLPTCDDPCSGEITVTPSFGQGEITYSWSHDAADTGPVGTTVCEQVVLVSATDANGCFDQDMVVVEIPDLEVLAFPTPPSCFGFNDGAAAAVATGGLGGTYTFEWQDAGGNTVGNTADITGLEAGGYLVTATDTGGCAASAVAVLDAPDPVDVAMTAVGISCFGATDGQVTASFADAVFYAWTGPNGFAQSGTEVDSLSGLAPGLYSVTVTASDGCLGAGAATVTSPDPLDAAPFLTPPTCPGLSDGVVGAVIVGGTAPFDVQWTTPSGGSAEGEFLNGVSAGMYGFSIEDDNGCTASGTAELVDPTPVSLDLSVSPPLCAEGALAETGSANVWPAGGLAPYQAVWVDVATEAVVAIGTAATALGAGTYGLGVSDALGCLADTVFVLTAPDSLTVVVDAAPPACFGGADGMIVAEAAGGTPDYNYLWGGDVDPTLTSGISGLTSGNYTLEVTDAQGCQITAEVTLDEPQALMLNLTPTPAGCAGDDGAGSATVSGGTEPHTVTWTNPSGDVIVVADSASGLPPGNYTAVVVDAAGCSAAAGMEVSELPPLDETVTLGPVNCTDGSVALDLSISGGEEPVELVLLIDGAVAEFGPTILPGAYQFLATDNRGCTADTSWVVHPPLALTSDIVPFGCEGGGVIQAEASGGNPLTGLVFTSVELGIPASTTGTTATWESVVEGTYTVSVSDGTCTLSDPVEMVGVPLFGWTVTTLPFACADAPGGIAVTLAGGTPPLTLEGTAQDGSVQWTSLDTTGLDAGTYLISAEDAAGCARDTVVDIAALPALGLLASAQDLSCTGSLDGAIALEATGGAPPLTLGAIDPSGTPLALPLEALGAGVYLAGVIDARGCSLDTLVEVGIPAPLVAVASSLPESCTGNLDGQAEVAVSGGTGVLAVQWVGGPADNQWTGLAAGEYAWTAMDENGCDTAGVVVVDSGGGPTAVVEVLSPSCAGGVPTGAVSISITGNGNAADVLLGGLPADMESLSDTAGTWTWSGLAAGSYGWTVALGEGCSNAGTVDVMVPQPLAFFGTAFQPLCEGETGAVVMAPQGGEPPLSAAWLGLTAAGDSLSGEGTAAEGLPPGDYTWTLLDAGGCTLDTTISLAFVSAGLGLNQALVQPSCGGALVGAAILTPFGGIPPYDIVVQGAADTTDLPFLIPGSYPLTLTDSVGCTALDTVVIEPASAFTLVAAADSASCANSEDGVIALSTTNGSGNVSYTFNGPFGAVPVGDTIADVGAGVYEVTALDEAGCPAVLLVAVGAPPPIIVSLDSLGRPSCTDDANGYLAVSVTGGAGDPFEVNWTLDGAAFATGAVQTDLLEGVYAVEAVDQAGCAGGIGSIPLVAQGDVALIVPGDTALCAGNSLVLEATATGATDAAWATPNSGGVGLEATMAAVGEGLYYWVFTAARLGCVRTDSVAVTGWSLPTPNAGEDVLIPSGSTAALGAAGAPSEWAYEWSPQNAVVTPESPTTATEPMEQTTVFLLEATTPQGCSATDTVVVEVLQSLGIPSGFTPNGDGYNDTWNLGGIDQYPTAQVTIFNRWGAVLLTLEAATATWDGTLNGIPVPVGTYYYYIRVDEPALQAEWTGPITIMR